MKKTLNKIEEYFLNYKVNERKQNSKNKNKTPIKRDIFGIKVPDIRKIKFDQDLNIDELLYIYENTTINEVQVWILFYIDKKGLDYFLENKDKLLLFINECDNWWISDTLSSIYVKILESDKGFLKILLLWNKTTNPWKRRQSIVSLLYYSSMRKSYLDFETMINLVSDLLDDPDYYVQKGVGRALREVGNLYPNETYIFLQSNIKNISSHAFSSSIEKLDRDKKDVLKNIRKK